MCIFCYCDTYLRWSNKMKVLYILNESPFYLQLAWFSISTLRLHNKKIPIEILMVLDNQADNRYIGKFAHFDFGTQKFDVQSFVEAVKVFDVQFNFIKNLDMKEEKGYISAQRMAFTEVPDDQILLLDADTFVMGDVEPLFEELRHHDIIADLTIWGQHGGKIPYLNKQINSINSGVVLFNYGLLNEYGRQVYDLSLRIKGETDPTGRWFSELQKNRGEVGKLGREEIGFAVFIHENKINFRLSKSHEIQTNELKHKTLIHHTQTQNYCRYWQKYFKSGKFEPFVPLEKSLPRKLIKMHYKMV